MPKALAKENSHGAPATALWVTNLCVQALLLWTLANASTYTNLVYLATSLILLPYLWSAAYQVLLAVRGETYESGGGRAIFLDNPVQRAWRDANAVARHVSLNWDAVGTMYGQHAFGLEPRGQY